MVPKGAPNSASATASTISAILYARGLGVEKDLGQSWLWFSLAAQQGDADAAKKRDEIAGEMDPASLAAATEALAKFKTAKP